jgi:uncharacterized protein (TIGR02145 family)
MKNNLSIFKIIVISYLFLLTGCSKDDKPPDPVSDIEGNTYRTIKIGSQIWMGENLKTTKFNDGTEIGLTEDVVKWGTLTSAGYCWYNNDMASFRDLYGALYNGYAVSNGNLCPAGWHIPEKQEWQVLTGFLGDSAKAGGKLKEAGTTHWLSPNKGADNSTGFTALAAGIRYLEGTFASSSSYTSFWSVTELSPDDEWFTSLYFGDAALTMDHKNKKYGFSIRCIKD